MTHDHDHAPKMSEMFTPEFWDERYRSAPALWSGNPNSRLVEHATDLTPGAALDIGSGEGADAIWLASRGWRVTGIDVSEVALQRAAERAAAAGHQVADRITWLQADLLAQGPGPQEFDLVSAQFMHVPPGQRELLHRRLGEAVRPGGTLLIVGHHPSDLLQTSVGRPHLPELLFTAEQVTATLDPDDWTILVAAAPERQATDPDGHAITIHDTVVKAQRRR